MVFWDWLKKNNMPFGIIPMRSRMLAAKELIGVMNDIPDVTTVAFCRERFCKANVIDELFEMF